MNQSHHHLRKMNELQIGKNFCGIEIKEIFNQKNSYNGYGILHGEEVFFKITDDSRARLEPNGYKSLEPFFPQPKFISYKKINENLGLVIFERVPELEKFENLLGGWMRSGISENDIDNSKEWNTICSLIKNTHEQTINVGLPQGPVEYFSRNKVKKGGKLDRLYGPNWEGLDHLNSIDEVIVDDKLIKFNWKKYKSELKNFGIDQTPTIKSISHGTLSELNLSILPLFFDVTSSGNNPFIADIVCFYLSISFTDDYIVPKFIPDLVPRFPEILKNLKNEYGHSWEKKNNRISVNFEKDYSIVREKILSDWYSKIMFPIIKEGEKNCKNWDWKNEFVQYSVLRTLSLFKLSEISESDQTLIISYVARLHDWKDNPKHYHTMPRIGKL